MSAEEPDQSLSANETIGSSAHKLPEQAKFPVATMPRQISFLDLIYQWQPMGIRITIEVPSGGFVGDDQHFLFLIRNGPFIPDWSHRYHDSAPDYKMPPTGYERPADWRPGMQLMQFAFNNTRNVFLQGVYNQNSGISIVHYDFPPILSRLSMAFRKWRGDMQYRIRVVSGFTTQGYVIASPIKNAYSPIGVYDEYRGPKRIRISDRSYRDPMLNAYALSDLSMFRHMEVSMPYDYPAPYYDQYNWLAHRVSTGSITANRLAPNSTRVFHNVEPHGDNFVGVGLRGLIANASSSLTNLQFELEYRACEGFQFADPGLLPSALCKSRSEWLRRIGNDKKFAAKVMPDSTLSSDGLNVIEDFGVTKPPEWKKSAPRNAYPLLTRGGREH